MPLFRCAAPCKSGSARWQSVYIGPGSLGSSQTSSISGRPRHSTWFTQRCCVVRSRAVGLLDGRRRRERDARLFARNLRKYRQAQGLSQEALAHEAGIDRTYISALERSQYSASITTVDKLATILGVEAAELLRRPAKTPRASKT